MINKGFNNKVKIETSENGMFCKKSYSHINNTKFLREVQFYTLFQDFVFLPKVVNVDFNERVIRTEFINGLKPNRLNHKILFSIINTISTIYKSGIRSTYNATEFIFSISDLRNYIFKRLNNNLTYINYGYKLFNKLEEIGNFYRKYSSINYYDNFHFNEVLYSPSDMGIHNSIILNGKLMIFDFEYAGNDSVYNLIFNLLLHPRHVEFTLSNDLFKLINLITTELKLDPIPAEVINHLVFHYKSLVTLRLINSLSDEAIETRKSKGILTNQIEIASYVTEIFKNLQYYEQRYENE